MKQIQNFKSLIVNQNQKKRHFVQSPSMFIMPAKIITNIFPDFPNDETLKVYIYLSMHCDSTYEYDSQNNVIKRPGDIFMGKQRIEQKLGMSAPAVTKSINWLEDNHFILRTKHKQGRAALRRVLAAPDYLPGGTPSFYSCSDVERTLEGLTGPQTRIYHVADKLVYRKDAFCFKSKADAVYGEGTDLGTASLGQTEAKDIDVAIFTFLDSLLWRC